MEHYVLEEIQTCMFLRQQKFSLGNLSIYCSINENRHKKLKLESNGIKDKQKPMMKYIYSTKILSAWKLNNKRKDKNSTESECPQDCSNVIDVLSLIPPELLSNHDLNQEEEGDHESDIPDDITGDVASDFTLPELPNVESIQHAECNVENNDDDNENGQESTSNASEAYNQSKSNILEAIVEKLMTMKNAEKWKHKELTPSKLFKEFLSTSESIDNNFTVAELEMIGDVYKEYTNDDLKWKKSDHKAVKVNLLSSKFGDNSSIEAKVIRKKCVPKLFNIAKKLIMKPTYPKNVLASAAAKVYHMESIENWINASTIPLEFHIADSNIKHEAYCYPEFCTTRNQFEMRLLNPTHLLTNMRSHCTRKNLDDCLSSAFLQVSKRKNDILPRAIVSDLLDHQSVSIVLKVFSKEVGDKMEEFEYKAQQLENLKSQEDRKCIVRSSEFVHYQELVQCM